MLPFLRTNACCEYIEISGDVLLNLFLNFFTSYKKCLSQYFSVVCQGVASLLHDMHCTASVIVTIS